MHGLNQRRRCQTWSNLPHQILGSIAKLLENDISSLRHFRLVCKNWNNSTTISHLLPHPINTSSYCCLFTSTLHLVNSSWIILSEEPIKETYRYRQIFSRSPFSNFPTNFNLNQFHSRQLTTLFHLSSDPVYDDYYHYVKVVVSSPKSLPSIADSAVLALFHGGKLVGYPPFVHFSNNVGGDQVELPRIDICNGSIKLFDDIVEFKGMILTLDRQGKLYKIDPYTLQITRAYLNLGVPTRTLRGWRKRLVATPAGKLYLVVRQTVYYVKKPPWRTKPLFKVYKLSVHDKLRVWSEIKSFDNRVLFVTQDCCFFVGVDGLGQNLKNCMVYSKFAFAKYSSYGWGGYTVPRHEDEIGVFQLDGHGEDGSFRPFSSFQNFPFVIGSCPSWARQTPTSTSHFRSQRESEEDETNHEMGEDEKEESNHGIDYDQVPKFESNTKVTPVMSYRRVSLAAPQGSSRGENAEYVTLARASIASVSKGSGGDSSRLNFRGLNICSELVPILEKVWSKHGNIMENITIRNGDVVARTLESLANAVQILEDNTSRTLNDEQADYLSSILADLQLVCFRVDWLAPKINDALAHHKSKHLMCVLDLLKTIAQLKARVSERKSKLFEKVAKYEQMEQELDSEMAKMHESIPALAQELEFDKPLGGLI